MKTLFLTLIAVLMTQITFAQNTRFQCVGSKEACAQAAEIRRLEQLTGLNCSGDPQECLSSLRLELQTQKAEEEIFLSELTKKRQKQIDCENVNGRQACWLPFYGRSKTEFHPSNPPKGVMCYFSDISKKSVCLR